MAGFIQARGGKPNRLILTHGHGDHILGGAAFAGAEIFAHMKTPEVIQRQLAGWAGRSGESVEQVAARLIWPTVTFQEVLRLDLGNRQLYLFSSPGHSQDGVCIYLEAEHILFAGDTVSTGIVPAISDGNSLEMESSLGRLLEMEIDTLVPGHGPVLYGAEAIHDWLSWQINYLAGVRTLVQTGLHRGEDPETLADAVEYELFVGDRLPAEQHTMPKRHRLAVQKIILEVLENG
jgi:glyoxylase-like metal-dependent hydrolase (beta-lactamase superfamily II)